MPKPKAAIVGTGFIATKKHIPAFQHLAGKIHLAAICDLDAARARETADRFNIPSTYTDVGEMLAQEKPDLVDVCTPPRTHAGVAVQAIEGGAHVLIEKPMAVKEKRKQGNKGKIGEKGIREKGKKG